MSPGAVVETGPERVGGVVPTVPVGTWTDAYRAYTFSPSNVAGTSPSGVTAT